MVNPALTVPVYACASVDFHGVPMRALAVLLVAALAALPSLTAQAQDGDYGGEASATRYVSPQQARAEREAIAAFGPFRVLDEARAALVGSTDSFSPGDFAQMMAAWPDIATLEFVECPGTLDDWANLRLGRMIRARGIAAVVPRGGSVRSGAVELFLAGAERYIADGAEFAVHAWLDERGLGAWDYAADSPEHQKYLAYYRDMGMSAEQAARFYAFTNSVPFEEAVWLTGSEMRGWIGGAAPAEPQHPVIARAEPRLLYARLDP